LRAASVGDDGYGIDLGGVVRWRTPIGVKVFLR